MLMAFILYLSILQKDIRSPDVEELKNTLQVNLKHDILIFRPQEAWEKQKNSKTNIFTSYEDMWYILIPALKESDAKFDL